MKGTLTTDDIWNIGFDTFFEKNKNFPFERNVRIPKIISEGSKLYFYKGYNDAKNYKEALNKKEDSDA